MCALFPQLRRLAAGLSVSLAVAALITVAGCSGSPGGEDPVRVYMDDAGRNVEVTRSLAAEFTRNTGIPVEVVGLEIGVVQQLTFYRQMLGARSDALDVFQIDVIWTGKLADQLLDLSDTMGAEMGDFYPAVVENNTSGGRLVAVPLFLDAPLLYYRSDLLAKYGFASPPTTWEELRAMAQAIQEGERAAGDGDFWGFVMSGAADEELTCVACEFQRAFGGGCFVDAQRRVTVNNPGTVAGWEFARGLVGEVAPPELLGFNHEGVLDMFASGRAAFMRNWTYAHAVLADPATRRVRDHFAIAPMPAGPAGSGATIGGWQLAVSRYSNKPEAAQRFVRFLTSRGAMQRRAWQLSLPPPRMSLYDDELLVGSPHLATMRRAFDNAFARPSIQTGEAYNDLSTAYAVAFHRVLAGQADAGAALAELEAELEEIVGR